MVDMGIAAVGGVVDIAVAGVVVMVVDTVVVGVGVGVADTATATMVTEEAMGDTVMAPTIPATVTVDAVGNCRPATVTS